MERVSVGRNPRTFGRLRTGLDVATSLIMVAAAVALVWRAYDSRVAPRPLSEIAIPREVISIGQSASLGSDVAPVVIMEFSDFECPFCAVFAKTVFPELKREFVEPGLVQFVFRHFPLTAIHRNAIAAAEAAECAKAQGKFWPAHDILFDNAKDLSSNSLLRYLQPLVKVPDFAQCQVADVRSPQIDEDMALAESIGIRSTPVFLVGHRERNGLRVLSTVRGAKPAAEFKAAVASALGSRSAEGRQ